jgi:hypothetical protein
MTVQPRFFGFGSLVNGNTHNYPDLRPAELSGWRRIWVPTDHYENCFLSVHRVAGNAIEGVTAAVPGDDWAALDEREVGYIREDATSAVSNVRAGEQVQVYHVTQGLIDEGGLPPVQRKPILRSYLDAVLLGFWQVHGESGMEKFVLTTDGWARPLIEDRGAPIYPRAQPSTPAQKERLDALVETTRLISTPL